MLITIYQKKVYPNALSFSGIEIECPGTGTKEDPVIIEPIGSTPKTIYLRDYDIFIHMRNLDKRYISLVNCQNMILTECRLQYLDISRSSNIKIKNLSVTKLSRIYNCRNMLIEDAHIEKLKIKKSSLNTFRKCSFNKIKKNLSIDNNFESVILSGKSVSSIEEIRFRDFLYKWDFPSLMYAIVLFMIFFILIPIVFDFTVPIPFFIVAISLFIFWYVFSILIRRKKK
ncbi:MAG: hypothetical protein ACFE9S_20550 [Candidatus Hermodarchaeota archaeon]